MRELLPKLAVHFAIGAQLGLFAALFLIMGNAPTWAGWLGEAEAPRIAVLSFSGIFVLIFGAGATLSGYCFISDEAENAKE